MKLPEKIYAVEYAGFFDFNESGKYDDSVINRDDYSNAEEIANEMANRYNSAPALLKENQELKALLEIAHQYINVFLIRGEDPLVGDQIKEHSYKIIKALGKSI